MFLIFVARIAFIANVCMLATFMMRYGRFIESEDIQSTIIIIGLIISFIANLIVACGVIFLLFKGQQKRIRPRWLFIINFLCFIFQLYLLLK